jgi:hypothetical protein
VKPSHNIILISTISDAIKRRPHHTALTPKGMAGNAHLIKNLGPILAHGHRLIAGQGFSAGHGHLT